MVSFKVSLSCPSLELKTNTLAESRSVIIKVIAICSLFGRRIWTANYRLKIWSPDNTDVYSDQLFL